ncbi:hypothetical protein, partial [Dolichospermum circinale]|uniref:hypothetical protein n=1 Tax=Dolichospermum circinale TaxID=109265 RepID=UPI0023305E9D
GVSTSASLSDQSGVSTSASLSDQSGVSTSASLSDQSGVRRKKEGGRRKCFLLSTNLDVNFISF